MNKNDLHFDFNAPLHEKDTPTQTFGCRAYQPNICANADIPKLCAFVRSDCICLKPSRAWKKQYYKLSEKDIEVKNG